MNLFQHTRSFENTFKLLHCKSINNSFCFTSYSLGGNTHYLSRTACEVILVLCFMDVESLRTKVSIQNSENSKIVTTLAPRQTPDIPPKLAATKTECKSSAVANPPSLCS